jgi:phosphoribosylformylglycinamidine cyclo-ligase
MSLYSKRGVSAQKEDVHRAIRHLSKGLFPKAFCKISPDYLGGDDDFVNIMHADGAGTKSILAYLYWKETGDVSVWKGIAQDAVVMNLDDLLCVGVYDNILFSSTIDRNKLKIPAEILDAVINGTQELFNELASHGIHIHYLGGETADVGDVVRTIAVNGTMAARWPKNRIISNENIKPGNVIVGLASYGQAIYEHEYNSGIASNGLTSARHDVLNKFYAENFKDTYDPSLNDDVVYIGKYRLTDSIALPTAKDKLHTTIGKLILSPTRTFAPVMKKILESCFDDIDGLIHSSGGGQTKCMKYMPDEVKVIKDDLFEAPLIFKLIQEASGADDKEMYQVFNMGTRMEIYTHEKAAAKMMAIASGFGIDAKIIGRVEKADKKELCIKINGENITYTF